MSTAVLREVVAGVKWYRRETERDPEDAVRQDIITRDARRTAVTHGNGNHNICVDLGQTVPKRPLLPSIVEREG